MSVGTPLDETLRALGVDPDRVPPAHWRKIAVEAEQATLAWHAERLELVAHYGRLLRDARGLLQQAHPQTTAGIHDLIGAWLEANP